MNEVVPQHYRGYGQGWRTYVKKESNPFYDQIEIMGGNKNQYCATDDEKKLDQVHRSVLAPTSGSSFSHWVTTNLRSQAALHQ